MYRIDVLLKQDRKLFHTADLGLLWGTENANTLYTTITRYVARGVLIPVQKGLYATVPLDQIDPLVLGAAAIHRYAYVTCETVLARAGVIFQAGETVTFVSDVSRRFTLAGRSYLVRRLAHRFLFHDAGIAREGGVPTATVPRSVADLRYFQPRAHLDNPDAVDWKAVRRIQREVGYL